MCTPSCANSFDHNNVVNYQNQENPESNNYLRKMNVERFEAFKSQDHEKGHFDVVFKIEEKKLYANKIIITPVSETLAAMCSNRWRKNMDDDIEIKGYSYENFYQLICFIYTGHCQLTYANVFQLIDMAEFYGVTYLKDFCDKFLLYAKKIGELSIENIEEMFEFAEKYSLPGLLDGVKRFSISNFYNIIKSEKMIIFKKPFIKFLYHRQIVNRYYSFNSEEDEGFTALYKWAEHKVMKQINAEMQPINLVKAIHDETDDILSYIGFSAMSYEFLMNFVAEKGFHISAVQLSYIFLNSRWRYNYNEENSFKAIYELSEKQTLKRQELDPSGSFNLNDEIRGDLSEVMKHAKFYNMSKEFLNNFIVANGFITEEQASHIFDTCVELKIKSTVIAAATFKSDNLEIVKDSERKFYNTDSRRNSKSSFRFSELKFRIPSVPSTVIKMKGVEWYLCLEEDGVLTVKQYSKIKRNDYLIAEMERHNPIPSVNEGYPPCITVSYNNI